ncbi:MAG: rhomboid family intramembrane serine protease [Sphingomonas sp.]|nr:rhomboid family intramembrane serine protease [Sphingomonas sp.]
MSLAVLAAWFVAWMLALDGWAAVWGGFIPARFSGAVAEPGLALAPAWLTPFTATFVHANIVHLGFNLLVLVFCGRPTESVVGTKGFILLYLLGAYAAAAAHWLIQPDDMVPMIGASGAISAVLGAYAMLFGRNRVKVASPRLALWLNALWLMAAWVVLQIVIGISFASGGIHVAIAAHIGGFLVGLLLAYPLLLLKYRKA